MKIKVEEEPIVVPYIDGKLLIESILISCVVTILTLGTILYLI